jgi:uncharacterized protein YkwD
MTPRRIVYLLLCAVSLAGSVRAVAQHPDAAQQTHAARPASNDARTEAAPATVAEQYLLAAANQERAARGLGLLRRDLSLVQSAEQHARAMAEHTAISHQFSGEAALPERAAGAGLAFSLVTENVGEAPSAVQIHDLWMNSEHHRTNLLDPQVDAVGIRVIARDGEMYAVEDFARTLRDVSLNEQEAAIGALVVQSSRIALIVTDEAVADARRTCAMSKGFAGGRKPWFIERFTTSSLAELPDQLKTQLASGRYHQVAVGACATSSNSPFASYNFAVLLFP